MSIEIIARETRKKKLTNRFGSNSFYFFNLKKIKVFIPGKNRKRNDIFFQSTIHMT